MRKLTHMLGAVLLLVACGKGGGEPTVRPETVPGVPQNVVLHGATETSLTFQWNAVKDAANYLWKLSQDGEEVKKGSATQRNVTISGLTPGTVYEFCVCASGVAGDSDYSAVVQAKTEGTPPDPSAMKVCVDAPVVVTFDTEPSLGDSGIITVCKADGTVVDQINLADKAKVNVLEDGTMVPKEQIKAGTASHSFMDVLTCSGKTRSVHYTPYRIQGKKLLIRLHSGVLAFDTNYTLKLDDEVLSTFTTKPAPSSDQWLRVSAEGDADFCTVQGALSYANNKGCEISIAAGTYQELLYLRDKANISLRGDSRDAVRIAYPNSEVYAEGTSARCLFLAENCNNLILDHLTLENTFTSSDHKGQAETIYFNSGDNSHRLTVESCALFSWQDTFLCKGQVWVHKSLIAGHCDFIWGYPKVCLFEECEIRARAAGYIVQARVPNESDKGFVFLNCNLTGDSGYKEGSMYLARSGGDSGVYDNVVFVNCTLTQVIASAGWYTTPAPHPSVPSSISGWREYGSVDPSGKAITTHNAYGKVLTDSEVAGYTSKKAILNW